MTALHETVQRFGRFLAGGNGVDGELGAGEAVAAHKDVGLGGLIGELVGGGIAVFGVFHLAVFEQVVENDGLSDGKNHQVGIQGKQLVFVVLGCETMLSVEYGKTFLEHDASGFFAAQHFLGSPAGTDIQKRCGLRLA